MNKANISQYGNNRKQFLSCWNHHSSVWFPHFQWNYSNFHPLSLHSLLSISAKTLSGLFLFFFFQISLLLNVAHLHTYKILLTLMNLVAISYDNFSVSLLIPELWGACTLAFIVRQTWARVLNCTFQNLIMLWFLVFFPFPTLWKQKQS